MNKKMEKAGFQSFEVMKIGKIKLKDSFTLTSK